MTDLETARRLLATKLETIYTSNDKEVDALLNCMEEVDECGPKTEIVTHGEQYSGTYLILDGWAARSRDVETGDRQIINFLLPGDVIGFAGSFLHVADHDVWSITQMTYLRLKTDSLMEVATMYPEITLAFVWGIAREESNLRDQIVGLGRKPAVEHLKTVLTDLVARQRAIGLEYPASNQLPLSQSVLADSIGVTFTHLNRCMRQLVRDRYLRVDRRGVFVNPE